MSDTSIIMQKSPWRRALSWSIYPACWALILWLQHRTVQGELTANAALGTMVGVLAAACIALEHFFPLERRWGESWRTLPVDLAYLAMNAGFLALINGGLALLTITATGSHTGFAASWPLWLQVPAIFLAFEAVQYPLHRFMHEGRGRAGDFMWRIHVAHHQPQGLHVLMHVVGHPVNMFLIRSFTQILPIWLLGFDPSVVGFFAMANGMHGLVSHFNVDVRMGWLNYIFVGPELHRFHHSSAMREAKNFGATLSVFDGLFGTLVYHPGRAPSSLGVANDSLYPVYRNLFATLLFPWARLRASA